MIEERSYFCSFHISAKGGDDLNGSSSNSCYCWVLQIFLEQWDEETYLVGL